MPGPAVTEPDAPRPEPVPDAPRAESAGEPDVGPSGIPVVPADEFEVIVPCLDPPQQEPRAA